MRLQRSVALVTGGASGLGRAIARRLADEGAVVSIVDLQRDLGSAVATEGDFTFFQHDVSNESGWIHVVEEIEGRFGRLNILVNNAGILGPPMASPENTTLESWKKIFAVNVEGVFLGCRAVIPAMRSAGGGSIINISSMGDRIATPGATAYGASKAAVRQLTLSVAQYCAQHSLNVRCNSVHPGVIRTPLWDNHAAEIAQQRDVPFDQVVAESRAAIPLGDFTRAEDVAAAVAFLASDDARQMTGAELLIDGGFVNCRLSALERQQVKQAR